MFWRRMTATAGWVGLVSGTLSAIVVFILSETGVWALPGQGSAFVGAGAAFVVDVVVSVAVTMVTQPKPAEQLVGLVYSLTPKESRQREVTGEDAGWYRNPGLLAGIVLVITILLNIIF
jgi:solute:Na+ symporter, SSS family